MTILALCSALLGAGVFRLIDPPGATRMISVEAVEIKSAAIKSGQSLVQETSWSPPDDVFIVGWAPDIGAPEARPELYLVGEGTTIFTAERGSIEGLRPVFLPAGTGYLLRKGATVKLRFQIINTGPDGESRGARALVYFHPVAWR
jgi:hypothetical protein